jgi:microcystin-dependent protein
MPNIGQWTEGYLDNWLKQRLGVHLPGNVQALVAVAVADATVPAGNVEWTARSTAPDGWVLADGSAISRSTFSALFNAIGTSYGAGDGSSTFNVPDIRGRVIVGKGTHADVNALTDNDGLAVADRTAAWAMDGASEDVLFQEGTTGLTNLARSSHTHALHPVYQVLNPIIKA